MSHLTLALKKEDCYGLILGGIIIVVTLAVSYSGILEKPELVSYDLRFRIRGEISPAKNILLITIDEKSVKTLNRKISQWPRSFYARVINQLTRAEAELIAIDLDLSRPSFKRKDEDQSLAQAINESNNVILVRYISQGEKVVPLDIFRKAEIGEGFINNLLDTDGILRRVPIVSVEIEEREGNKLIPYLSFSTEIASQYLYPEHAPEIELSDPDIFKLGEKMKIPYPEGKMLINYIGPPGSFPSISFGDVYRGNFSPQAVKGKIILIGNTHPAYHDYFLTPFREKKNVELGFQVKEQLADVGAGMSGMEIHANALQTMLEKKFVRPWNKKQTAVILIILGIISSFLFIFLKINPLPAFIIYLALSGIYLYLSQLAFTRYLIMTAVVPVEGLLGFAYIGGMSFHRILALKEKARVTRTFGHYVSYQVVERLLKEPGLVRLGGEKKELTVMFSDIRGFTSISEKLNPEAVVQLLNEYLTAMTKIVFKYGGVLDKYMGDAIMAFYGAPLEIKEHGLNACLTALEMIEVLQKLQQKWKENQVPLINIGIGINSGPMVVGNMGSDIRFDYTVMGDSVNLASRLEGINKLYGTRIVVSEFTREITKDSFVFRELDIVKVKGKDKPVKIFDLISKTENKKETDSYLEIYNQGLEAYRRRNWESAVRLFEVVLASKGDDGPSSLYIERCRELKNNPPPPDWDGVYVSKTK